MSISLNRKLIQQIFGKERKILIKYKLICAFVCSPKVSHKESKASAKHYRLDKSHHIIDCELDRLSHQAKDPSKWIVNKGAQHQALTQKE